MLCGLFGCAVAPFPVSLVTSLAFIHENDRHTEPGCLLHLYGLKSKGRAGQSLSAAEPAQSSFKFRGKLQPKNLEQLAGECKPSGKAV